MRRPPDARIAARKAVGHRLRSLRLERNLTQEAVADDLGIGHSTVCAYENGTRPMSIDRLADFAEYYGVSVSFIASF